MNATGPTGETNQPSNHYVGQNLQIDWFEIFPARHLLIDKLGYEKHGRTSSTIFLYKYTDET